MTNALLAPKELPASTIIVAIKVAKGIRVATVGKPGGANPVGPFGRVSKLWPGPPFQESARMHQVPTQDEYKVFLSALGNRVRDLRKQRGLPLRDIIVFHGYHESHWRKYEKGGSLNVHSLMRIAEVLEVSLSQLLEGLGRVPQTSVALAVKGKAEKTPKPFEVAVTKPARANKQSAKPAKRVNAK